MKEIDRFEFLQSENGEYEYEYEYECSDYEYSDGDEGVSNDYNDGYEIRDEYAIYSLLKDDVSKRKRKIRYPSPVSHEDIEPIESHHTQPTILVMSDRHHPTYKTNDTVIYPGEGLRYLPCKSGSKCKDTTCTFAHNKHQFTPLKCTRNHSSSNITSCPYLHPDVETVFECTCRVYCTIDSRELENKYTQWCTYGIKCIKLDCTFAHTIEQLRLLPCGFHPCISTRCTHRHSWESMKDAKDRVFNTRRKELTTSLAQYGLVYRNDSRLCTKYIEGSLKGWTLDMVVERMCEMNLLFEYTDFGTFYPTIKGKMLFEEAERLCLFRRYGISRYPPGLWPWLA
jgi:hypothetical protein